jgi:HEAT repeat protein
MTSHSPEELVAQLGSRRGGTRQAARETLVKLGRPAADLLVPLASNPAKQLRWEATKALAEIADPRTIPVLVERLGDAESGIRWLAATGLINIGPASVASVLRLLMARPASTDVRRAAHHVLHDMDLGQPELREALAPVLASLGDAEPADTIPPKAQEAVQRFEVLEASPLPGK